MKLFICFVFVISLSGCVFGDDSDSSEFADESVTKSIVKDVPDDERVWTVCGDSEVRHVRFV
jgi:hypothetical protein